MSLLGAHLFGDAHLRDEEQRQGAAAVPAGDDDASDFSSNDSFVLEMAKLDHRPLMAGATEREGDLRVAGHEDLVGGQYVRSRTGVALRAEVDEGDVHDYAFKVSSLHESLTPEMLQTIKKIRDRTPLTDFDRECVQKGVNIDMLRDLKAAFSIVRNGMTGVPESAFASAFCPALCEHMTTEEIRLWFRNIDKDCSGAVAWPEIAEYIGLFKGDQDVHRAYFVDFTVEVNRSGVSKNAAGCNHRALATKIIHNASLDMLYTCSPDGLVCGWNPHTLMSLPTPVHDLGSPVLDMSLCQHNNRLLVLQADSSVFIYDTFLNVAREPQHTLFRGYAGKAARTLHDGTSFYEVSGAAKGAARRGMHNAVIPVSRLQPSKHNFRCLDNLGLQSHGEGVAVGTEGGELELYNLVLGSVKPITPFAKYSPHTDWVTSVRHAPEMLGLLTSSLDGSCVVTDVETGATMQVMALEGKKRKPVHVTEYHQHHNVFATGAGRTVHIWNALTGARLTSLSDHEATVTGLSINAERQHLYAMQENKTVKVWDLRTWRSLDEAQDTMRRVPFDSVGCISWCKSNHLVVAATTSLFGWRPADVQERLDAGLHATAKETRIHLLPIVAMHCLNRTGHIWSLDHERGFVWGADGKHRMKLWKPEFADTVTASFMVGDELRAVVGTERGRVMWINYANGSVITELKHGREQLHVRSVLVTKGVIDTAPPLTYAVLGRRALGWSSEKSATAAVIKSPIFEFELPSDVAGVLEFVFEIDAERKLVGAVSTYGLVSILTFSLSVLNVLEVMAGPPYTFGGVSWPSDINDDACEPDSSADPVTISSILIPLPGVIVAGCSDGFIRVHGVQPDADLTTAPLLCFRAAATAEAVTAMARLERKLVVGDGDGDVMIFECKRLFDPIYMAKEVLAQLNVPAAAQRARNVLTSLMDLEFAYRAHRTAVHSLGFIKDGVELISAGDDKHIRAWRMRNCEMVADIGRVESDMEATAVTEPATDDGLPPIGTVFTTRHPYLDSISQTLGRSSENTPSKGRSIEFLSGSFDRALGASPSAALHKPSRSRRQSAVVMLPNDDATGTLSIPGLHAPPALSRPGSRGAAERSRRASLAAMLARGIKPKEPEAPKTVVSLPPLDCFHKATDRAMHLRHDLVRDDPFVNAVQDKISTVDFVKEKRSHEVREETKRAFNLLTLPRIAGNPFAVRRPGEVAAQTDSFFHLPPLQRRSRTSLR